MAAPVERITGCGRGSSSGSGPGPRLAIRRRLAIAFAIAALVFETGFVAPVAGATAAPPSPAPVATGPAADDPLPTTPDALELDPADEVIGARTATTRTYDLGGGRYAVEAYADPLFYQPPGSSAWRPIDLDFAPTDGGARAVVTEAPVRVTVGAGTDGVVTLEHARYRIALRPIPVGPVAAGDTAEVLEGSVPATEQDLAEVSFEPVPVVLDRAEVEAALAVPVTADRPEPDRQRVDLPDVLPGVGLRVFAHADGTSNFLVLPEAPTLTSWTFAVSAPGLDLVPGRDGALEFRDRAGTPVATMPAPYAVDSTPDEATGSGRTTTAAWYTLATLGDVGLVTVSVDAAWLADAVYPVYVDPSVTVYNEGTSSNGDVHVNEGNASFHYANYQRPDSPYYHEMWLGESPSDPSYFNMDFVQFALSAYDGTVVDAASLEVRPYHQYYNPPTTSRAYLRRVTESWVEDITWTSRPSATSSGMTWADCVEGAQCAFNITAIAADWRDGDTPDYGVRIDEIDTNGVRKGPTYWKRLIASEQGTSTRPRLLLTYHTPVSVVSPDGGATAKTAGRTLSWATESGWGQDAYRVEVSAEDDFSPTLVTSNDVIDAAARAWAIPAGTALTPGATYYWRVKARRTTARATTMWSQYASGSFTWDPGANLGLQTQHTVERFDLGAGDALNVNVATGNLVLSHPIVALPIRGGSLPITLAYNSHDPANAGLGAGWRLSVQRRLEISGSSVTFADADGARHVFTLSGGVYSAPTTIYATLTKTAGTPNVYTLTYRDQSVDVFHELATNTGYLKESKDRFANTVTFGYAGTTLASATDPAGRVVSFGWAADRLTITDWANVANGVVQTTGTGNRTHRVFLAGGTVAGWADAHNPGAAAACPSASHTVCLAYTGGLLTGISRLQTYTTLSDGVLGTATRSATTTVGYRGTEVASVQGPAQASGEATTISRPAAASVTVVRHGTPDATTSYGLAATTDPYARVTSAKRLLGTSTWIEQRTTWDATYPIEPQAVVDNYVNGIVGDGASPATEDRKVAYTYAAGVRGPNVTSIEEPLAGTLVRRTELTYNDNQDVTQRVVSEAGDAVKRTTTRYCYTTSGCSTSATDLLLRSVIENYVDGVAGNGTMPNEQDVTTTYQYDAYGQRTRETRYNHRADGMLLDSAATGWTYDTAGNQTAEIRNYANGTVTSPGDDITPNGTTNARTDLTTVYGYDTAGNRTSSADPRRAIEAAKGTSLGAEDYLATTTYDALNATRTSRLPTTPGQADCTPSPACRTMTFESDELGLTRQTTDLDGKLQVTAYDAAGRPVETSADYTGAGGSDARYTGKSGYDAAGRLLWSEDAVQATDPAGNPDPGRTEYTYDELGRTTAVKEAAGALDAAGQPDPAISTTTTAYDALGRRTDETTGTQSPDAQTTRWRYDLAGRVLDQDDEFTCTTTAYDYRDLATSEIEGRTPGTPCTGSGSRTVSSAHDGLGRLTSRTVVGGDTLEATTYDAAGRALRTSATEGSTERVTETTWNPLDEVITEYRYSQPTGGGAKSGETWARANRDPAGNETDRCTWAAQPTEWCHNAADTSWAAPAPTTRASAEFDARNNRIKQYTPGLGTTTYDPTAGYQVKGVFIPTGGTAEHQTLYGYDTRDRLDTISVQLCAVSQNPCQSGNIVAGSAREIDDYGYDDNDNRASVVENNGAGAVTRYYCHDARNQLVSVSTSSATCASGVIETYAFDAAGNRTTAAGRTFTYQPDGQLESCTGTACAPAHDADGRITSLVTATGTWSYLYDAEGRLVAACRSTSCAGSGFARLDFDYDGEGHRTRLTETPASGTATVTDFTYEGDKVVRETATTGTTIVTRTFTVDEAGGIVKMTLVTTPVAGPDDGTYLVVWSGHGDALELAEIDPVSGGLTPANRFAYSTWGAPTLSTVNGYGDLGFRYRYVGRYDVEWDSTSAVPAELLYMHARHYAPEFGRFLQPDPSDAEANLYGYAGNSPVSRVDPGGFCYGSSLLPNPAEAGRCGQRPRECAVWAHASLQSFLVAGRYGNPKKNAMRHCVWQCLLTHRLGWSRAAAWGRKHEEGSTAPFDTKADYHNNYVGRLLGEHLSEFYLPSQVLRAQILCSAAWDRGWLWYVKRLGDRPAIYWSDGRREWNPQSGPNRP